MNQQGGTFIAGFPLTRHSSSALPQSEGEYDQGQPHYHSEGTDERYKKWHIGPGQDRKEYAKEHRQGAASGQQPSIFHLDTQQYRGEYLERTGYHRPHHDHVDQP